jgi:gliding motility associated protien GldN
MKMMRLKLSCVAFLAIGLVLQVAAQTTPAKKPTTTKKPAAKTSTKTADPFGGASTADPFGAAPATTKPAAKGKTNNKATGAATNVDPFGAAAPATNATTTKKDDAQAKSTKQIPVVVIPSKGGSNPLMDSVKESLRNDNGNDVNHIKEITPLELDHIREDDAFFKQRIWSIIDAREKMNLIFKDPRNTEGGSQLFFAILFRAVTEGNVTAFADERFTEPISKEKFLKDYAGGYDTVPFRGDLDNPDRITEYQVRAVEFPVDSVYQFQVKEDIIFDKESSRLVRRIIGIAPMVPFLNKGKLVEGVGSEAFPKFWIYYDDIRPILAKYRVYNPKNFAGSESWDDIFISHKFSSYIVKTTYNNYKDLRFKDYINDPLFRLLEGEKVKEKIFNFEQNLWAY